MKRKKKKRGDGKEEGDGGIDEGEGGGEFGGEQCQGER